MVSGDCIYKGRVATSYTCRGIFNYTNSNKIMLRHLYKLNILNIFHLILFSHLFLMWCRFDTMSPCSFAFCVHHHCELPTKMLNSADIAVGYTCQVCINRHNETVSTVTNWIYFCLQIITNRPIGSDW